MPHQPPFSSHRPHVFWRVGVTGHRDLSDSNVPNLRSAVARVLELVGNTVREAAAGEVAMATYAPAGSGPTLRLLSPLAEGADRLVAKAALLSGYQLEVAMPFAQAQYEQDFDPESVTEFRTLLDQASDGPSGHRVLAIDGSPADGREKGYKAVGRFVLRNCDLLIAVWDGQPAAGRGGTAEIVRSAVAMGLPVWWINPATPHAPQLLRDGGQPLHVAPDVPAQEAALVGYIREVITPPQMEQPHRHGCLGRLIHHACSMFGRQSSPLEDYLREKPPSRTLVGGVYARFMRLVAPVSAGGGRATLPAEGAIEHWWERNCATATGLSNMYGDLYRSSYILVFFLAGSALLAAILAFAVPPSLHVAVAGVELAALLGIALLVGANHLYRWQERWIQYRLFAELCREQRVLAPLGWTLPVRDIARLTTPDPPTRQGAPHEVQPAPRDAWVAWYFAANRRACPMPTGTLSGPVLSRVQAIGKHLVHEQLAYHQAREQRSELAARRLAHWGDLFFVVALAGVILRIGMELMHLPTLAVTLLGVVCSVAPTASATFLGIRAYAEFELLARQSARMQRTMADAARQLDALTLDRPLASTDLGNALFGVTAAMLLDIDGWAQLFQAKAVEAG